MTDNTMPTIRHLQLSTERPPWGVCASALDTDRNIHWPVRDVWESGDRYSVLLAQGITVDGVEIEWTQ